MAIRTVIVDDEKPSREEIKLFLKRFPNFEMPSGGDSFFTFSLVKQGGEWLIKV